jgi:formylglycine-generating enzyme required for sulfatase activity
VAGLFGAAVLFTACEKKPEATASSSNSSGTAPKTVLTKSGIEAVFLPGGQFTMGASDGNPDEAPPHKVTVTGFLIDKLEVTHEMFAKAELPDPSHWQENPKSPVERVRWRDAKAYCNERSKMEGLTPSYNEKTVEWDCDYSANGYRLPTEAEWEFAARAGTATPYDFGSPDKLRQYAWYNENSDQKTHGVGQKKADAWGLSDMDGNVSEWCEDVYSATYYAESPATDPTGPPSPGRDVKRVMRGGNWNASAEACRVTYRRGERTGNTDACFATDYCGFRCVRRISPEELATLAKPAQ